MQDKATLRSDQSGIQGYTFCRGQASDVPITTGWNLILQKKKDEFDLRLKYAFFQREAWSEIILSCSSNWFNLFGFVSSSLES